LLSRNALEGFGSPDKAGGSKPCPLMREVSLPQHCCAQSVAVVSISPLDTVSVQWQYGNGGADFLGSHEHWFIN